MHKIIFAIFMLNCSLYASCGGCGRGESILSRATDLTRISLDNLYTYNVVFEPFLLFPTGTPVVFNGPVLKHGDAITQLNPSTFLITKTGRYLTTFVAAIVSPSLEAIKSSGGDGVEYQLNGVSQGVIMDSGTTLVLNQILNVTTVPTTLQVVATGIGLLLTNGTSSTLSVVRVSSP